MRTFLVSDGDLVVASDYVTTTGTPKVVQDLQYAMLEPVGCDRFHNLWGSVLASYIGRAINLTSSMLIKAECVRIANNYIAVQRDQLARAAAAGERQHLTMSEILDKITDVRVAQISDTFAVRVQLRLASGDEQVLVTEVTA